MPYFTFVYGDLHAHMISMPLMIFAIGFVLNEILLAGREDSPRGLALDSLGDRRNHDRAVPCREHLGVADLHCARPAGVGSTWWLRWRRISRGLCSTLCSPTAA